MIRFGEQVQWEYREDDDSFLPYPPEKNMKIEKAFIEKEKFYQWGEDRNTFRITFADLQEEILGTAGSRTDVRRKCMLCAHVGQLLVTLPFPIISCFVCYTFNLVTCFNII